MDRRRGCAFEGVQIDFNGFLIAHTRIVLLISNKGMPIIYLFGLLRSYVTYIYARPDFTAIQQWMVQSPHVG